MKNIFKDWVRNVRRVVYAVKEQVDELDDESLKRPDTTRRLSEFNMPE